MYGTNGLKTIECTHTRNGQRKKIIYIWIYNIYMLFTHRYIVLHVVLVRARLRDQDLDVERAFFVRFSTTSFIESHKTQRECMRMCERARDAWEGHHKMPIDLADPALSRDEEARRPRSIGQRANFRSAGRFRDLRPAVWEARNSRRKKEEKKIDEADVRGKEKRQAEMRGWLSSPRSFVVHNKERGKRKIQDIPWATWYRQQRERKRKNSTDGSRTAGRTSTHPVVPICDQRGQQDVSRISLTRFSGKYLARLNFCAWFSTRVLVTCTIYNTGFSRQQKKHVTATMGWFFFFFIWDLRVTLVPDGQR